MTRREAKRLAKEANERERARRLALVQPLVNEMLTPTQIARRVDLSRSQVAHLVRHYCERPEGYCNRNGKIGVNNSICLDEADPSGLTEEQLDMARRVGITPGRFAWMVACPRITEVVNNRRKVTRYA